MREKLRIRKGDFGKIISDTMNAIALANQALDKMESERCLGSRDNCNVHKLLGKCLGWRRTPWLGFIKYVVEWSFLRSAESNVRNSAWQLYS